MCSDGWFELKVQYNETYSVNIGVNQLELKFN